MRRLSLPALLILCLGLVGCDHATKYSAKSLLEGRNPVAVISGVLDLTYVENTDMAFNSLRFIPERVRKPLLLSTNLIMLVVLASVVFVRRRWLGRGLTRIERVAAFLALAGAAGNTADRALRGYVVDFVHLHHWPVFNVADVYLGTAIGLVVLSALLAGRRQPS